VRRSTTGCLQLWLHQLHVSRKGLDACGAKSKLFKLKLQAKEKRGMSVNRPAGSFTSLLSGATLPLNLLPRAGAGIEVITGSLLNAVPLSITHLWSDQEAAVLVLIVGLWFLAMCIYRLRRSQKQWRITSSNTHSESLSSELTPSIQSWLMALPARPGDTWASSHFLCHHVPASLGTMGLQSPTSG